jgi:serine protease AprX
MAVPLHFNPPNMNRRPQNEIRWKAVWGSRRAIVPVVLFALAGAFSTNAVAAEGGRHRQSGSRVRPSAANSQVRSYKLDRVATAQSARTTGTTHAIIELQPGAQLPAEFQQYADADGKLDIINSVTVDVPNRLLKQLANNPAVARVHYDRPVAKHNYRTALTTGTRVVQQTLGLTGAGIGVAVIDSGITSWHDDLTNESSRVFPFGDQRVAAFVDFVNRRKTPYDDDGHGTHVAGAIAGNGYDSKGSKSGVAPDASLVSLKVLDAHGVGTVSNIIKALDWVLSNRKRYNIRVVNLSVGAAVTESYWTDPLALAVKRVVDAGVVVVAAAGNFGKNAAGLPQYGGISAPANCPWVMTVGASSTNGTSSRDDDTMAGFSSRGPTYIDWAAKPDLVAPGYGTVSLSAPESEFYRTKLSALLPGLLKTATMPYLSLSGTSMAAPVVSGTVALMLQVNPKLTPNAVKAILQYTAQQYKGYDALTEGAGFLNAVGAIRLARFYAAGKPNQKAPTEKMWSKQIIWGSHRLTGGTLDPFASAFRATTTWGAAKSDSNDNIVWGTSGNDDNIVWGTSGDDDNIVWGTADDDNIVWGTDCGGADCDNVIWGTTDQDNIVWGTAAMDDNIVWGTAGLDADNIVWGTSDTDDNIVWGMSGDSDNIVWGTSDDADNIVWGTDGADNIVWGTAADADNIVWGTSGSISTIWVDNGHGGGQVLRGADIFDRFHDQVLMNLLDAAASPPPAKVKKSKKSVQVGGVF